MGLPSNNPVRIPKRARRGEPIKASQYNELVDAVRAFTQRGIPERLPIVASDQSLCALGNIYDGSDLDGASEGDVYLASGFVNAAGDSYSVGGPEGTILTPTIGDTVYAECDVEVEVSEGVLTGGWSSSAANIGQAATLPTDDTLDDTSTTGTIYAPLGEWISNGLTGDDEAPVWQGSSCGNVTFILCVQSNNTATANFYRG